MNIIDDENKFVVPFKNEENKFENVSLEGFKELLRKLEKIISDPMISFRFDPFFDGIVIMIKGRDLQGEIFGFRRVFSVKESFTLETINYVVDLFQYAYKKHNEIKE